MFIQACHRLYPYLSTTVRYTRNEYMKKDAYVSIVDGGYRWILYRKPSNRVLKQLGKLGVSVTVRYNPVTSLWYLFMLQYFSFVVC